MALGFALTCIDRVDKARAKGMGRAKQVAHIILLTHTFNANAEISAHGVFLPIQKLATTVSNYCVHTLRSRSSS